MIKKAIAEQTHLDRYFTVAVFLLPALSLNVPSGYSYGAVMLLLGSFYCLPKRGIPKLPSLIWATFSVMVVYAIVWMVDGIIRGDGVSDMDRPSRFLFAAISLLAISQCRIPQQAIWLGVGLGSAIAGVITVSQTWAAGVVRAHAYATDIILFGNFSMTFALMSLCGVVWALRQRWWAIWVSLLVFGAVSGIAASLLSASRGAWLALPVGLIAITWLAAMSHLSKRISLALGLGSVLIVVGVLQTNIVQTRAAQAVSEVDRYMAGEATRTSTGYRLEMWRGALHMFSEKPLLGHGEEGYQKRMIELEAAEVIVGGAARFGNAHSLWMDTLAKKGLIGAVLVIALFLLPVLWFARFAKHAGTKGLPIASAGMVMCLTVAVSGLTHTQFANMGGVMMYGFMTSILLGSCASSSRYMSTPI